MGKLLTLCIIKKDSEVLLGMKKRGFGEGRWNGFGGKVGKGEAPEEAAKRELKEEVGIVAKNLEERGVLNFEFENDPEILEVHVFYTSNFKGKPTETEEMKPKWFKIDEIPYGEMWPADKYWLPLLLKGKKFRGDIHFFDNDFMLNHHIEEI